MKLYIRRKLLRSIIRWRRFKKRLGEKMSMDRVKKQSMYQQKAIELWSVMLKDKETMLHYSNVTDTRQLHKKEVLVSLYPGHDDYHMCIIDHSGQRNNLYEVLIRKIDVTLLIDTFDVENDRRMRHLEGEKRMIIYEDLDFLLDKQRKALQKKKI